MSRVLTAIPMLLVIGAGAAHALEVSKAKPAAVIVAKDATVAEQTAAREVAYYLGQVTGAKVALITEPEAPPPGNRVFVGPTVAAGTLGLDPARLGPEAWIVRTAGN